MKEKKQIYWEAESGKDFWPSRVSDNNWKPHVSEMSPAGGAFKGSLKSQGRAPSLPHGEGGGAEWCTLVTPWDYPVLRWHQAGWVWWSAMWMMYWALTQPWGGGIVQSIPLHLGSQWLEVIAVHSILRQCQLAASWSRFSNTRFPLLSLIFPS